MDKDLQKKVTVKVRPGVGNHALGFVLAAVVNNCYILLILFVFSYWYFVLLFVCDTQLSMRHHQDDHLFNREFQMIRVQSIF